MFYLFDLFHHLEVYPCVSHFTLLLCFIHSNYIVEIPLSPWLIWSPLIFLGTTRH